jgi:ribose 5-phosphate isomerase A
VFTPSSGMTVSVGTGTIGLIAIGRIGEKLKNKEILDVTIVPCSEDLKKKCISLGIPVSSLSDVSAIDIAISGADEIDPSLNMIKGKTGSLLREKMVEQAAKSVILLIDDSKLTRKLGPGAPLAVEVIPYSHQHIRKKIESLPSLSGCRAILRRGNINNNKSDGMDVSVTDNGNYIIDIFFNDPIKNIEKVANDLNSIVGVVEHGLFMRTPYTLIISDNKAVVHTLEKLDNDFWFDLLIPKSPLDREALDNRDPIINNINNKDN